MPHSFTLIPTTLGPVGLGWSDVGIRRVHLPEATPEATAERFTTRGYVRRRKLPSSIEAAGKRIAQHLRGRTNDLREIALDLSELPAARRRIYEALRRVPPGRTVTYGELAELAGMPGAAQGIGTAMAENPCPLVVPCHRVLGAGGKLGGFSAPGGAETKARLLRLEGVNVWAPRTPPTRRADGLEYDWDAAVRHLRTVDPILAPVFRKLGDHRLEGRPMEDPFLYLARSVTFQQLAGAAARTIWGRVLDRFAAHGGLPSPERALAIPEAELRGAGLSAAKLAAIRDLAVKAQEGIVPRARDLARMSDDEIVARLTAVRGVGRWTVEMLLMFRLGRADVLPVDDLGVRKGFDRLHGRRRPVTPRDLAAYGERWRPYRTVGSWMMWRVLEQR
ncbi:MAG TPA: methylated-DNA--[protein]-cysteine S-methyltransferase [Gemmatimonadales bacterium]|nr:methylated-DNA--[protein]-cysteine S-methyltransferase [Gemmatimonadales bacterium]